ncbi:MAG: class I SAM-dependent methyltransferase [Acidimicrobiia bacterium]
MDSLNVAKGISTRFREKRFDSLVAALGLEGSDYRILDVGGKSTFWSGSGFEDRVTLLNIDHRAEQVEPFSWVTADACDLSQYADGEWDVVVSNSVIEHVGDFKRQKQMASEVRRVSKMYWVQAPYMHFPLEPHFLFPFFQYLSEGMKRFVARWWPISFPKMQGRDPIFVADTTRLPTKTEWAELWPDAVFLDEKFAGLTKSMVAVRVPTES